MKLGMTFGLIGGILLLILGLIMAVIGGAVGGAAYGLGSNEFVMRGGLLVAASLGLPIMAIVGAALSFSKQKLAAILMAIPGGLVVLLSFGGEQGPNLPIMALGGLLLAGAYCTYSAKPAAASAPGGVSDA